VFKEYVGTGAALNPRGTKEPAVIEKSWSAVVVNTSLPVLFKLAVTKELPAVSPGKASVKAALIKLNISVLLLSTRLALGIDISSVLPLRVIENESGSPSKNSKRFALLNELVAVIVAGTAFVNPRVRSPAPEMPAVEPRADWNFTTPSLTAAVILEPEKVLPNSVFKAF
jgi:hypothetical protein